MATGRTFALSLVTPDGAAFEGEVEMLIVPGDAGEIGVLARHAPLVAMLKAGSTRIYRDRDSQDVLEFATGPGFFKVEQDRALALVDDAVDATLDVDLPPEPNRRIASSSRYFSNESFSRRYDFSSFTFSDLLFVYYQVRLDEKV